jgi:putative nucleotidyltransferase with HDIG domain
MVFASGGREAWNLLSNSEFDLLVTDIRMRDMSGIELLSDVANAYPAMMRMVLSGTAELDLALQTASLAHQCLSKPCDAPTLRAAVERAFALRAMLDDPALKRLISRTKSLPSMPSVYMKLMDAMRSANVSAKEVGEIVAQDIGMTAKLLQLVNSAFFGVSRKITNPSDAVVYLGLDTVRSLALTVSAFSQFDARACPAFSIDALSEHSSAVGSLARRIARGLSLPKTGADDAFVGGLLHDIGKLVLACNCPNQYQEAYPEEHCALPLARERELAVFGTTHAEVGGYLLRLWGLPDSVVEIVARHHSVGIASEEASLTIVAVTVADALLTLGPDGLNRDWLAKMGLSKHVPQWEEMHRELQPVQ